MSSLAWMERAKRKDCGVIMFLPVGADREAGFLSTRASGGAGPVLRVLPRPTT